MNFELKLILVFDVFILYYCNIITGLGINNLKKYDNIYSSLNDRTL